MATISLEPRRLGGGIVITFGVIAILSGLWLNPVIGRVLKGPLVVDFADVLKGYFWWSMIVGIALIVLGRRVARGKSRADGLAMLAIMVGGLILFDRFLLTRFGLPLWKYDAEIRYHHRPGVTRTLVGAGRPEDHVVIDRWGFHDTEFPLEKPSGEFRALMLGDSVTMGFGVTYKETFSAHLEELLDASDAKFSSHQVINTGVHGYSTFQEKRVLERTLVFEPDVVFVGFCLNDVTEPFVVDEEYGGTGLDYHGVSQTPNPIVGWLMNETGLGRLLQTLAARGKTLQAEKRLEVYNARAMAATSKTDPKMQEAWRIVLKQMGELYDVAKKNDVPVVLVIFPYTFQLADESLRAPQEILTAHAAEHGVPVIDTTNDFVGAVFDDPELVAYLKQKGKTGDEVLAYHRHLADKVFFDEDHFTDTGHRIVAQKLYDWLAREGYVGG
ncbi:MAG TPA: SGNH/GDSL hydrolase family protein [Nannocystaceae bacterium]|nr:SGNH/GDSL hydrolase family protein [Nannocystaceae bacterium]